MLSNLRPAKGAKKRRKRLGFGEGSGSGKTCGKGTKGHKARSGYHQTRGFEGGQMPLHRRLPKFGFTSRKRILGKNVFRLVKLEKLLSMDGQEFTLQSLIDSGLVRKGDKVKLLGGCDCSRQINVEVHAASESALEAVKRAGGEVKLV